MKPPPPTKKKKKKRKEKKRKGKEPRALVPTWGVGSPCCLIVGSATEPYALGALMEPVRSFERKAEAASPKAMGSCPLNDEARIAPA
jgi:hypothetical protein